VIQTVIDSNGEWSNY